MDTPVDTTTLLTNEEFFVIEDGEYYLPSKQNLLQYYQDINFYESTPGGKPINRNIGKWFIITGNTPITPEITSILENYHMIDFYNYQLSLENIPKHITHIKISGDTYNHPLNNIPEHILLFYMALKATYNFALDNLPPNLKVLQIDNALEYPLTILPYGLLVLVLNDYLNHIDTIELPHHLMLFSGLINSIKQIVSYSCNLKIFCIYAIATDFSEPVIFQPGLKIFYMHNVDISSKQIEALPDSVVEMYILIYKDDCFIKFPESLVILYMEETATINFKLILPTLLNLEYISIQYRCIENLDVDNLPPNLNSIYFMTLSMEDGIFFPAIRMLELVNNNPEFSKYKNELEYCLNITKKRTYDTLDDATNENSDDEYIYYKKKAYNYNIYSEYNDYIDTEKDTKQNDDDERTRKIKKRIIRKYISYIHNKLIEQNITIEYDN